MNTPQPVNLRRFGRFLERLLSNPLFWLVVVSMGLGMWLQFTLDTIKGMAQ